MRTALLHSIATEATEWRRTLHRNPQTMYEETFASNFVCEKLTAWGIPFERDIAVTGVVATIEGRRNQSGRAIAFRADMDALDITEASGQPWASHNPGKMHACGHDGHTATLLTLARYLSQTHNFDGTVRLIFQPAEEGGRGAFRMLDAGLLERFPFDEIYGYHNWPFLPRGTFSTVVGPMLASVDDFEIELIGRGGHAAMVEHTADVLPAAATLVSALQTLVSREIAANQAAVVSITNCNAGTGAFNVISGRATLNGTVRTFRNADRDLIERRMRQMAEGAALMYGATAKVDYRRLIDPVINHREAVEHCQTAAAKLVGDANLLPFQPMMGGEDFGGFLSVRPGAFIAIGQAEPESDSPHNYTLHSPKYDFNDRILPLAAEYFAELAETRLRPTNI
ncbi:MAG: amidohydrolase [Bryobacterales bacterium]|nr:amidohydrolase [Bryobacterales bacterium]